MTRRSDLGKHPLTPAIWQSALCLCGFPLASHRDSTNRTIDCDTLHIWRIARRETYPVK